MPRRSHKKSRNGCFECKGRHVKCDENRPECVNCLTAGSRCSFNDGTHLSVRKAAPGHDPLSEHSSVSTPSSHHAATSVVVSTQPTSDPSINLGHLELLHHFLTKTVFALAADPAMLDVWTRVVPRYGLSFPFLMYELLAVAALHLGHLRPDSRDHYYDRATELQNSAMARFHGLGMKIDESNCGAVLIFSSLLGMQVIADPTPTLGLTSSGYIDHIVHCIKLMQGTRVLVVDRWWACISNDPELVPLWDNADAKPRNNGQIPDEVKQLTRLTQGAGLDEMACAAYNQAIEKLQWLYTLSDVPNQTCAFPRWALAWPVTLRSEFSGLLNEKRPESLIILAYYGALLHFYRESWIIGNAGARMVAAISEHVGAHWEQWMRWPNKMVRPPSPPE